MRRYRTFPSAVASGRKVPSARVRHARTRVPLGSDLGIFGKGKRILHVDPEIAHRVLDLAMAEKDLDSP